MARTRRVESEREQEKLVDDYMTRGYKVKQRGQYSTRVKQKDWGSAPVHGFVFLFSLLGGAVLFDAANASAGGAWVLAFLASGTYAAYSWFTAEEILIKVDEDRASEEDESDGQNDLDDGSEGDRESEPTKRVTSNDGVTTE